MIENHILDNLYSLFFGAAAKFPEFFIASETCINLIIISSGITMVGSPGSIVFQHRIKPNGCITHTVNIIKVVNHPLDITTMATKIIFTLQRVWHPGNLIVAGIPIGKTIRHYKVHHIRGIKSLPVG